MLTLCLASRYELSHVVRTHMGASDNSYGCVFQKEDSDGVTGAPRHALPHTLLLVLGKA